MDTALLSNYRNVLLVGGMTQGRASSLCGGL